MIEEPECRMGYTHPQLVRILGERLPEFNKWMYGQTMTLCEGRQYNHDTKEYEVACDGVAHGGVVYSWDLNRFLRGLPVID